MCGIFLHNIDVSLYILTIKFLYKQRKQKQNNFFKNKILLKTGMSKLDFNNSEFSVERLYSS